MVRAVLALLLFASTAYPATLTWTPPTVDGGGVPIPWNEWIVYTPYVGPSSSGPWTRQAAIDGGTWSYVPNPAPGTTMYYTLDYVLRGVTSYRSNPVYLTEPLPDPIPVPTPPPPKKGWGKGGKPK